MVDHRRTPSQRTYRLPGWFFVLTGALSLLGFGLAGWVLVANPFGSGTAHPNATVAPSPSVVRTAAPTQTPSPEPSSEPTDDSRSGIQVLVLNATHKEGLAADVAATAKKAGWKVADVGNWPYPAAQNAVYYPEGHKSDAELLGDDLSIASVRPARPGMSTDQLTVILLTVP